MPAGLQVFNDDNVLQIDEGTRNYELKQSGSGTCNTSESSGGRTRYYTTIAVTSSVAPMMALGNCANNVCLYRVSVSGSTWTFVIVSDTNGATFDYWVFDVAASSPATFGLEVYTAAGDLSFHSVLKPLRIVGVGGGTYPSGRTYAVIMTSNGFYESVIDLEFGPNPYQTLKTLAAVQVASNVVTESGFIFESFLSPTGTPGEYTSPVQFVVVDVTHF